MYFNEELNKDIEKLKELRRLHLTRDYHVCMAEVMKKHNISKATLYRHLDKSIPGLTGSNPLNEAAEKISPPADGAPTANEKSPEEKQPVEKQPENKQELTESELFSRLRNLEFYFQKNRYNITADILQNFFRQFFEKVTDGDYKKNGLRCAITDDEFILEPGYVDDICLIFANAYAYYKLTEYKVNRDEYLRMRVRNLVEQSLRKTGDEWITSSELEAFTRMFKRLELKQGSSAVNLDVIRIICEEFKPGVTLDEIIAIFKKKLPDFSLPLQVPLKNGDS